MGGLKKPRNFLFDKIYNAVHANKPLTFLMLISLLASIIIFSPIIFGGNMFVYTDCNMDTSLSYIPLYELVVNYISDGMFGSLMNFSYNLGSDMLAALILMLDPFSAIIILSGLVFGNSAVAYAVGYVQIITILASAFCCYKFLALLGCDPYGNVIGSFCFAFSGYMIGAGQHYQFAVMTFLTIYSLLTLERYIKDERRFFGLVISLFLVCVRGVYAIVMIGLILAVYYFMRMIAIHRRQEKRAFWSKTARVVILVLISIGMSAFISIDGIYNILNSGRVDVGDGLFSKIFSSFKFNDFRYSYNMFLRALSELSFGTANHYTWTNSFVDPHMFMGIICVFCVVLYIYDLIAERDISKKQRILCLVAVGLVAFSLTNTFVPMLVHAFSYATYRFTMVLNPFFAYCIAKQVPKLKNMTQGRYLATVITGVAITVATLLSVNSLNSVFGRVIQISILLTTLAIILIIAAYSVSFISPKVKKVLPLLLLVVVFLNVTLDGFFSINVERWGWKKDHYNENHDNVYIDDAIKHVNSLEGDEFFRIETVFSGSSIISPIDYAYMKGYRSASFYTSTMTPEIINFKTYFGNPNAHIQLINWYACGTYGELYDIPMANTLGIKYILTDHAVNNGWREIYKNDLVYVYENPEFESALQIYTHYITETDLAALPPESRIIVLNQAAVVDDDFPSRDIAATLTRISAPIFEDISKSVTVSEYLNAVMTPGENGEAFVISGTDGAEITWSRTNADSNYSSLIDYSASSENGTAYIDIVFTLADGSTVDKQLVIDGASHSFNAPDNWTSFTVKNFDWCKYSFARLRVLAYQDMVHSATASVINEDMGGNIKIKLDGDLSGLVHLPIEYKDSWSANTDDELIRSNFCFTSIYTDDGSIDIELNYENKAFIVGLIVSALSLMAFVGYCIYFSYYMKKQNKEQETSKESCVS